MSLYVFLSVSLSLQKVAEPFLSWATGLKTEPSQVFGNTRAVACLQQVIITTREVSRRSRSGAFTQSPRPPKAEICVLLAVPLKDSSRHCSSASHFNTYAPRRPENTRNPSITDDNGRFVSDCGRAVPAQQLTGCFQSWTTHKRAASTYLMGMWEPLFPGVRPLSTTALHHGNSSQSSVGLVLCSEFSLQLRVLLDGDFKARAFTQSSLEEFSTKAMTFSCSRRYFCSDNTNKLSCNNA